MSKELTKKKSTAPAVYDEAMLDAWGENEFDSSDIIIPKLILMQGGSELVNDGVARPGDYIHSVTKEVIGNKDKPAVITPIHMKKFWRVSVPDGNKHKFESMYAVTPANMNDDKEFMEDGIPKKRQFTYQYYVLIEGHAVPFILQLRGMSFSTGKQLANEMYVTNKINKLPPPGVQFNLGVEDAEFDGSKHKAYTISPFGNTPIDLVIGQCIDWYKTILAGETKEDQTDEDVVNAEASEPVPTSDAGEPIF